MQIFLLHSLLCAQQVVAVLNPLAKEKLTGELQDEIAELQHSLNQAHEEVGHLLGLWRKLIVKSGPPKQTKLLET